MDKESGAIFVDRFMTTAMHHPHQLRLCAPDPVGRRRPCGRAGHHPYPLHPGVVVPAAPGHPDDGRRGGVDGKVIAVPTSKILPMYDHWKTIDDVNAMRRNAIAHFFEHYKDLEKGQVGQGDGLGRH